ncbi:IucA/IucC family siderophore biosynthesis protein [Streptomyces sp. DSM 44915]|uniref:IucA/IucC family siderophore biosynthesis protein n=1 Tax=Streptomyces chisholmiae TaxID=3075540 RepID=A0ABU2JY48_9ACTN|nr:IucA/IucC family siderophore biosynthesis protein [Streptomyces sp. DSM 44915]MDT0269885.1 IucA/IucC family siderophore biosynthesis protein [Streptomyces sp. DSM 44915]
MTLPHDPVAHLAAEPWARANRLLVRKALAEFSHERLLTPELRPDGHYAVRSDDDTVTYRFAARPLKLDHLLIDPATITRQRGDESLPLDALDLILEFRTSLGISDDILPVYLEEITSTLASSAYRLTHRQHDPAALARQDFQTIEAGMFEGHPCFVANNGRLGFTSTEFHAYAPEAGAPLHLVWLAAHRDHATFTAAADLDYEQLIAGELSAEERATLAARMTERGLDLDDYYLLPAHPWQWRHKISVTFAAEVAQRRLVYLGTSQDRYRAQQSIRTFFNLDHQEKHYVKTAISVLNMGFVRGLSARYMRVTPAINDWLADLVDGDKTLARYGFGIIRERAAIGYHHPYFEAAAKKNSSYLKMLAALWRESPLPQLRPGQRLATMASLLHADPEGPSLVGGLIEESGLPPAQWLRRYVDAYLVPLVHCAYAHDLMFMPHGENVILVLENGVPERILMKDLAEEIAVLNETAELPEDVQRIRFPAPREDIWPLTVFTDVFDCVFRFLSAIMVNDDLLDEETFWRTVAEAVTDYQRSVPELAEKFQRYDLFAEGFHRVCLNRLQLRNNQQMVNLDDPDEDESHLVGTLDNPLAAHRPRGQSSSA